MNKVLFFTSENMLGHLEINAVLKSIKSRSMQPILICLPPSRLASAQQPSLKHFGFYSCGIATKVIYPYLNKRKPDAIDENDTLNIMGHEYSRRSFVDVDYIEELLLDDQIIGALSIYNFQIFNREVINTIRKRGFFWNLHHGLLPDNRGLFLPFWNLLEGKLTHGCSLHEIDQGIDTGRLIDTFETPLDPSKPVIQAYVDLIDGGAAMIIKALETYMAEGSVPAYVQDKSNARYYSFPTEADIARARDKGIRLWGTPLEMLRLYQGLFGADEELTARIVNAIAEFETGADTQGAPDAAAIDNTIVAA